ncbi:MAG: DUF3798 domain-containing protein [Firmicutes bacterium]|nr:DUF3798 domain-containing protein [Bacillota bacterium]
MPKLKWGFVLVFIVLILTSCTPEGARPEPEIKIAIITSDESWGGQWHTVQPVIDKFGADKVIHATWPSSWQDPEQMIAERIEVVDKLGEDLGVKAIIVNPAVPGINAAFEKLRETRKDIFVVYCQPHDIHYGIEHELAQTADLIIARDELGMGSAMVEQAHKLGAKTFVHYSIESQMMIPIFFERRALISQKCDDLGIEFVDHTTLDPRAGEFLTRVIPRMVEEYGKDTAFFGTHCELQPWIIEEVVNTGAIYPQPCCPSPFHGFDRVVFDTVIRDGNAQDFIDSTRTYLAEHDMLGRFSNWPVQDYYMYTYTLAEYAFMRINGQAPAEGIDIDILKQLMADYAGVDVDLNHYVAPETGTTYENYLLLKMGYLIY